MLSIVFLVLSLLLNGALIYAVRNMLLKLETAEDFIFTSYMSARKAYLDMQELDTTGAFASDDEVGRTFASLQEVVLDHARFVGVEEALDEV